jgi:hypothetical protein
MRPPPKIDPLDRQQKKLVAKGIAPKPITKSEERAAKALASARNRSGLQPGSAISLAHAGVKENPLHTLERIRRSRRINELTGRGTSIARLRRHHGRNEDEDIREELEREECEEMDRREEIAKLGLAPPLPQCVLRPGPNRKKKE